MPAERLGRAASVDAPGSYALLSIASGLAGITADRLGVPAACVTGGAISFALIALGLPHPAMHSLD